MSTLRPCALGFALALFLTRGALAQSAPPTLPVERFAVIEARLAGEAFAVYASDGVALMMLGVVDKSLAVGPFSTIGTPPRRARSVFGGRALVPEHPAAIDALVGRPVRVVGARGLCEGTLGQPVVAAMAQAMALGWRRELAGLGQNLPRGREAEAAFIDADNVFLVAPIIGCTEGFAATTRMASATRILPEARRDVARTRAYRDLYHDTPAFFRARALVSRLPSDWPRPARTLRRFTMADTREVALVYDEVDNGCTSSATFPVIFDRDGTTTRAVGTSLAYLKVAFDLFGDGTPWFVFADGEVTYSLMRLPTGATELERVFSYGIDEWMGC